eukprot:15472482-Alexandrium_andersonii.AAC.1
MRPRTSGADLAQRVGFLTSGPLLPAIAGSGTRVPKLHRCPTTAFTCGVFGSFCIWGIFRETAVDGYSRRKPAPRASRG